MTNAELTRCFDKLNRRFFDGVLLGYRVRFEKLQDVEGYCRPEDRTIGISLELRSHPDYAIVTLLHEMCHGKLGIGYKGNPKDNDHGMRFQAEIVRLFEAGAYDGAL